MPQDVIRKVSTKYCPRFGQIAVGMGFITELQMMEAFRCQFAENLAGHGHRLLGQILMDKGWMTSDQVEKVLNIQLRTMRMEDRNEDFLPK